MNLRNVQVDDFGQQWMRPCHLIKSTVSAARPSGNCCHRCALYQSTNFRLSTCRKNCILSATRIFGFSIQPTSIVSEEEGRAQMKQTVVLKKVEHPSMATAIRQHCLACSGGQQIEVRRCGITNCPLFPTVLGRIHGQPRIVWESTIPSSSFRHEKPLLECDDPEAATGKTIGRGRCLSAFTRE